MQDDDKQNKITTQHNMCWDTTIGKQTQARLPQ